MTDTLACDEVADLISAYVDGELSEEDSAAVANHIASCPGCTRIAEDTGSLIERVRNDAAFEAPPELSERIRQALPPAGSLGSFSTARMKQLRLLGSHMLAAGAGAFAIVLWQTGWPGADPAGGTEALAGNFVSAHVRKMFDSELRNVESSDPHKVRPWFAGKLPFSPPVVELDNAGFPLIGAYVDYVDGQPAAAVRYRRREHAITVFIRPVAAETGALWNGDGDRGFHVLSWQGRSFAYWVVSDLNRAELREFADGLREGIDRAGTPALGAGG